jgi:transcriptional regulator with XRE-family HTH domain
MKADRSPRVAGGRLRAARLGAPMSLDELAEKPGLGIRTISDLDAAGRAGRILGRSGFLLTPGFG